MSPGNPRRHPASTHTVPLQFAYFRALDTRSIAAPSPEQPLSLRPAETGAPAGTIRTIAFRFALRAGVRLLWRRRGRPLRITRAPVPGVFPSGLGRLVIRSQATARLRS